MALINTNGEDVRGGFQISSAGRADSEYACRVGTRKQVAFSFACRDNRRWRRIVLAELFRRQRHGDRRDAKSACRSDGGVLVGQIPLEALDYVVDLRARRLIGNPDHGGELMYDLY